MTTALLATVTAFLAAPRRLLVGADWVEAADGATFDSINPARGERLATVSSAGPADVDRAVAAARAAFDGLWRWVTPMERGSCLWRVGELILAHQEELAQLETLDTGKPLGLARVEVPAAAAMFQYYAGWCTKLEGSTRELSIPGLEFHAYSLRQPLGVVGLITPWNFPIVEAAYKIAPAVATGNTVVLKPAEETPLTALRLGELCLEAGLAPGVVNVVSGFGETAGAALAEHRGVDKVSFTGSTETGRLILRAAAGNLKKITLELGGKSANIVFADSDLDAAVAGSAMAAFFNQGEVCTAGSRLFVQEPVFDAVLDGLCAAAKAMRLGDGLDPAVQMGPLISAEHRRRVAGYVEGAADAGATIAAGGATLGPGWFHEPTVLTGAIPGMPVVDEEVFGPVVTVTPFRSDEEVLAAANATPYGLAAGLWTRDLSRAHWVARRLEAGIVWINTWQMSDPTVSVGGVKQSGWGYDLGPRALDGFLHDKAVVALL
ncbi:MAG TPA: aldehyde dehydrogenase family protein [Acidimicrobiia bacterium]|nr:aldehyde dehydrogenase family protein [Acidimicrobiia bacterium]